MSLGLFGTLTLPVKRPTSVSDHGAQSWKYPGEPNHSVSGVDMQPGGTAEDNIHRDGDMTSYTLFLPIESDLKSTDRVVYADQEFSISGVVQVYEDPITMLSYKTARLIEWNG